MARRRAYHRRDLPPNLYERNNGYYTYRNPRDGREHKLGRNKRLAITEAIAANMALYSTQPSLVDRINGVKSITVSEWVDQYKSILESQGFKDKTMADYSSRLSAIHNGLGHLVLANVNTKNISEFINQYIANGKHTMAKLIRSTLSGMFKEAISHGHIESNPVAATRSVKVKVSRERLSIDEFLEIRKKAKPWMANAMSLALLTGQRLGDIANMKWVDIVDGSIMVKQIKTGAMLAINMSLSINEIGSISDIVSSIGHREQYIITTGNKKKLTKNIVSVNFTAAKKLASIDKNVTFHEIRSLSARLYAEQKGSDFAKKLLGHKSMLMTDKYLDGRNSSYIDVS